MTYTFEHKNPAEGTNYYRLKMAGTNGTVSYSSVAVTAVSCEASSIHLLPNPVSNTLQITGGKDQNATVVIYSTDGRTLLKQTIAGSGAQIDVTQLLPGTYTVQIVDIAGHVLTVQQIVKK